MLPSPLTFVIDKAPSTAVCSTNYLFSSLVRGYVKFNSDLPKSKDITPISINYRTRLCLRRICMFFPLNILLLALAITAWLSQFIDTDGVGLIHKGISLNRSLSHSTSELAFSKAINSTSIVDRVMQVCLDDSQEIAPPPRVKMYQLVAFISSESKIQLASLNPSRTFVNPL